MPSRSAILLGLQLVLGVSGVGAFANRDVRAAYRAADSVTVGRNDSAFALEQSERRFLPFAGKRVVRIQVRNLDVFGTSIADTTQSPKSRLARSFNNLNFRTRATTVRRYLLFREGDPVDPFRMADSERILRNLGFIQDARIVVGERPGSGDSVNVLVIVKESWGLALSASPKEGNGLKTSLTEQNLLGLGHEVSGALTIVPDLRPTFDAEYSVDNIRGYFVDGQVGYARSPWKRATAFALSRDLVSSVLEYAGGLNLVRTSIVVADSLASAADNASDLIDLWVGRSFHLRPLKPGNDRGRVLLASARVLRRRFSERPAVTPSTMGEYHNVNYVLGSIGLIQNRYYRTRLLYNFGRVDDVAYGFQSSVAYGLANEEFNRSAYASAALALGQRIRRVGYGVGELRIGGNHERGTIANGVIRLRTLYFSNLVHAGGHQFRQFITAEYTTGLHRPADDSIDFNGDQGIRGVVYDHTLTGSKRLKLSFETVTFTPWKPQDVTFAFFTFADLDIIGSGQASLLSQEYYSGLGLGIRLHKESFGIGPVQLRFAWYPRLPIDHDSYTYTAFGEKRFRSIEFVGDKPDIVEY